MAADLRRHEPSWRTEFDFRPSDVYRYLETEHLRIWRTNIDASHHRRSIEWADVLGTVFVSHWNQHMDTNSSRLCPSDSLQSRSDEHQITSHTFYAVPSRRHFHSRAILFRQIILNIFFFEFSVTVNCTFLAANETRNTRLTLFHTMLTHKMWPSSIRTTWNRIKMMYHSQDSRNGPPSIVNAMKFTFYRWVVQWSSEMNFSLYSAPFIRYRVWARTRNDAKSIWIHFGCIR